jgi:hypothetical protein
VFESGKLFQFFLDLVLARHTSFDVWVLEEAFLGDFVATVETLPVSAVLYSLCGRQNLRNEYFNFVLVSYEQESLAVQSLPCGDELCREVFPTPLFTKNELF